MANAYISNYSSGTVSVVDIASNTVTSTITIDAGPDPMGVAVSPDGSKVYVTNFISNTVSVINTSTNTVSATISVGTNPRCVAVTPNGSKAYVTNFGSDTVSVINTSTNTVSATITVDHEPLGIAITPNGSLAYVANLGSMNSTISVINTSTDTVSTTIPTQTYPFGDNPFSVAASPDGTKIYVISSESPGAIIVISTATNTVSSTITGLGNQPQGIAITPNGSTAYVANVFSNTVSVVNLSTGAVSSISVGTKPTGVSITLDGTIVYVTNFGSGSVSVINTATNTVSSTITVGTSPQALGNFIQQYTLITGADMPTPQGRLTLSSTLSVMTADATVQSTVYYLPYQGAIVPVYNGTSFINYVMGPSGISLALDSNSAHTGYQAAGSLFDVFAFVNSSVLTLATGPAWTNSTTRSNAISQVSGIWVNTSSITLRFGSASGNTASVAANQATYLGTMYATANGQTGIALHPAAAAGGTANVIGLWNAYNRVKANAVCSDSTTTWSYGTNAIRAANNSNSNRIYVLDGLAQSSVEASYQCDMYTSSTSITGLIGVCKNFSGSFDAPAAETIATLPQCQLTSVTYYPALGLNYYQAVENNQAGTGTVSFQSFGLFQALTVTTDI